VKSVTEKLEFIRSVFGECSMANNGADVAVSCPACGSSGFKKKLSINIESWQFHCWVCGIKGKTLSHILRKYFTIDIASFYESSFNISTSFSNTSAEEEKRLEIPQGFMLLADHLSSRDPDVRATISYCKKRGLGERAFWRFKLGTTSSGRFRRRVIIPSFDDSGDLNYFVARSIDEHVKPKYVNSPVKKTEIIFNELDIDWSSEITIVEGPFDLVKCGDNATCLLGSEIGKNSLLFKRIISNKTPVLLALDRDMIAKQARIAQKLEAYCCTVRLLDLKHFSDVGEMTPAEFQKSKITANKFNDESHLIWKIREIESGSLI